MIPARHHWCAFASVLLVSGSLFGAGMNPYNSAGCAAVDPFFTEEVWAKLGALECVKCHKLGGDAEDSKLVLHDLNRVDAAKLEGAVRENWGAFSRVAKLKEGEEYRLLLKVTGQIKHGGKQVVEPDSAAYRILAEFVRRVNTPVATTSRSRSLAS